MSRATLLHFAQTNDAVAATASKLQKQAILAAYFRELADEQDLRLAVRYAGGRAFASTDERVLGASGAIINEVVLSLLPVDPSDYYRLTVESGEIGEALSRVWDAKPPAAKSQFLTLRDLSQAFDDLAQTGNFENKKRIVGDLFSRCNQPREATYLAKIIFSDLRTGAREGVLQAAVAQAFEKPLREIQRAQLLLGDLDEVAVLARRDELAVAHFRLFHPIQFMLATPQETAQEAAAALAGRAFFAEDKLDGIRAQVHKSGDRVAIYTRTMDRTDESFPDVVDAMVKLPGEFLLDGEIVPWKDGRVLPFAHIQRRLGRKQLTRRMLRENPAAFIAFDILYRDGELLMDCPLRHRREALSALARGHVRQAQQVESTNQQEQSLLVTAVTEVSSADEIERAFCLARDCRNEGLILKDPESPYSPGRRGQMWFKLKTHLPTIDCVVTAAEYGHGKRRGVLSDYTFAVWDGEPGEEDARLVNVGKAYSGVSDEEIAQLTQIFLELSRAQHGHVHVVEPKIVLEIACDQIQRSQRHASGYALRFPRIKRIRWDKRPEEADRLARVIEIYESAHNFGRGEAPVNPTAPERGLFDHLT